MSNSDNSNEVLKKPALDRLVERIFSHLKINYFSRHGGTIDGDVDINGTLTADDIYSNGGVSAKGIADLSQVGGRSQIEIQQILDEGEPIANITVNGDTTTLYAPVGGGGGTDTSNLDVVFDDELPALQAESSLQVPSAWSVAVLRNVIKRDNIPAFDTTIAYKRGDIVLYDGEVRRFTSAKDAGEWRYGIAEVLDWYAMAHPLAMTEDDINYILNTL